MNANIFNADDYNLKIERDDYLVGATFNGEPVCGHYVYYVKMNIFGKTVVLEKEYKNKSAAKKAGVIFLQKYHDLLVQSERS